MAEIASEEFTLPSKEDGFVGENINQKNYVEIIGIGGEGWTTEHIPIFQKNLFDEDYSRSSEVYWYKTGRYLIIKFNVNVNIWRIGVTQYGSGYNANLKIYKLDDNLEVIEDVTNKHTTDWRNTITEKTKPNNYFVKFCSKLPAGVYKFLHTGARLEGGWLLEGINSFLIRQDNKYYCPIAETYNTETKLYDPIKLDEYINYSTQTFDLFTEVTIGEETFKPIDKFNKFSIVSQNNNKMTIRGTKSSSELIVANGDIDVSIAETIHSFVLKSNQTSDTNIKAVLSLNEGKSWNTYFEGNLVALDVVIPLGGYNNLTSEQKKEWDNAKQTILKNGIPVQVFNALDFNTLTDSLYKLRFAYVVLRENYNDLAELDSLQWNFDAKGIMRKMKNSEYDVCSYLNKIIVTTSIDTEILNTNIMI